MATDLDASTTMAQLNGFSDGAKPTVIGIYGIPGSGKSFLLNQLRQELGPEEFEFYEGSEVIAGLVPGGLDAFKKLEEPEKDRLRRLAIECIRETCVRSRRVAIVAGHFMFWTEGDAHGRAVHTDSDLRTFTHIIYLSTPPERAWQQRTNDTIRPRPTSSIDHLQQWQEREKDGLRKLCYQHGILFSVVLPGSELLKRVSSLVHDFRRHTEDLNRSIVDLKIDDIVAAGPVKPHTMLVLDADRTLSENDSGKLFWDQISLDPGASDSQYHLKTLFSSPLGYSYTAFRQATLLYEDFADDSKFESLCEVVARAVVMYPEFVALCQEVTKQDGVGAVVITCGLRRVWEKVLNREGLSEKIKVIGGGRLEDGLIIDAAVKATVVARLRARHNISVLAFGDSVLDLPMLHEADEAIVVVGNKNTRSKVMDGPLLDAIENGGLSARQLLLPSNVPPRLDTKILPVLQLADPTGFINSLPRRQNRAPIKILHATERNAAKQLMTPMRDARVSGPALREAHRRVGWYLATEFLTDLIGVEEYSIPHVQGHQTSGYRLRDEGMTLIVALMRGGEPMALGVNDAFPSAMFLHAKNPEDVKSIHLLGRATIVLVDSVVNSGKTVVDFLRHIRGVHPSIRAVVVAGVVQARAISEGILSKETDYCNDFSVVALRLSDNKFTGRGTTDTGNRLFNTTHIT
ncbi:hypothetical protein TWF718_010760 [Orbilia javanica]|uniref:Phosphoribosyltransferase domain-containing protein n=1 Tax=Orbilia javanica TaxID=47235 RepID=A0AAN8MMW4_9PEZI